MPVKAPRFEVIDTTLRDGAQSPLLDDNGSGKGIYYFSPEDKLLIAEALMRYGVRYIELFSPIVSKQEKSDLAKIIEMRDRLAPELPSRPKIIAHVRCDPRDVEAAIQAGVDGLNFYMGTSPQSREYNHGRDLKAVGRTARSLIEDVRKNYPNLELRFSGEDAFRTSDEDLFRVYDLVAPYLDRLGTPDTTGFATPQQVEKRVILLRERYPDVELEGHFHNDRGWSLINAFTAVKAGMRYIDTSVLGLGERSGITSLTGLLFNIYLEDPGLLEGYTLEDSYPLNVLVAERLRMQVPYYEPVSATNRTHKAGVHAAAPEAYAAHDLARFGVNISRLLLSPLIGWHGVMYYLEQFLGYQNVTKEIAIAVRDELKTRFYKMPEGVTPDMLLKEIVGKHRLAKTQRPVSHIEQL